PAAADLEHVVLRPELERRTEPLVLRSLRGFERLTLVLEDGARVRHRRVEHEREQLVTEVVVVRDVAPRAHEPVAPVQAGTQLEQPAHAGVPHPRGAGILEQELEQRDEVVALPLTCCIRLAEAELAARREAPEERAPADVEPDGRAPAEPPDGAVRERHFERSALELGERMLEDADRRALEQAAARSRLDADSAHGLTEPSPATNGGL